MTFFQVFMLFLLLTVGAVMGTTPYFSRLGSPFGLSVPYEHRNHPFIKRLKRKFLWQCIGAGFLVGLPLFWFDEEKSASLYAVLALLLVLLFQLLSYFRQRMLLKEWKRNNRIQPDKTKEKIVVDTRYQERLHPVSNRVLVGAQLLVILLTAVCIWANYDKIPAEFPVHWNAQNEPDRIVQKTVWSVFSLSFLQLLLVPVLVLSHYSLMHSKQKLLPWDPEAASAASRIFRQAWSFYLLIVSVSTQVLISLLTLFSLFFSEKGIGTILPVIVVYTALMIGYSLYLSWKYGQSGEKLLQHPDPERNLAEEADEEAFWKGGMFYYNPDDPSVFVEKRFGIGSTLNMARRESWLLIGIIVLFIAGTILLSLSVE